MPHNDHTTEPHHVVRVFSDVCRNCKGTGKRDEEHCHVCEGRGVVKITKDILIYVEPITKQNDNHVLP